MTNEQTNELIKELKRLNDILLNMAQVQSIPLASTLKKDRQAVDGIQELPKIRKPTL